MVNIIREFRKFPLKARRYILYHSVISPGGIVYHAVPIYLFYTGYNILEIGTFYTIINFVSIVGTYFLGRLLDKIEANKALTLDILFDSIFCWILAFAKGTIFPFLFIVGSVIQSISAMFSPAYFVYEFESYPEEMREKIYVYHFVLPEISQLITFPIFGIIWGILYPTPNAFRIGFFIFGIYFLLASILPMKFLPPVKKKTKIGEEKLAVKMSILQIPKELKLIMLIEILLIFGWGIIPEIILANYVITVFKGTLFHITIIEAIIAIVIILTGIFIKDIGKKYSFTLLIGATFVMIIYSGLMSITPNFSIILVAHAILAFGDVIWHPYHQSMLFHYVPKKRRGEFFGFFTSIKRIIGIFFPFLAGFIAHKLHPLANYAISCFFFFIVVFLYLYLRKLKTCHKN